MRVRKLLFEGVFIMKRKLLSLALALALCVSFFPATSAEGKADAAFSDVPAGSWYESGIKLCAEKGIMIGMGDGTFAPDKTLTAAECLTLALRLYDLCHGGKGIIEKAPENWDQITITAADGTAVTGRPGQPFQYQGKGAKGLDTEGIWFAVQAGQESLAQELNGMTATVSIHGKDYPATLSYSTRSYIDGTSENILFAAYTGDDSSIHHAFAVTTNNYWWADSAAMVQKLGLYDWTDEESNGFRDLYVAAVSGLEATARRAHFADSLATAAGSLPVLQEKVTIPDLGIPEQGVAPAYENILMLYRAGVLNGKDASGSFDYYGQLTRAEAATMVARVLDPTLRIGAKGESPAPSQLPINVEVGVIDSTYPSYNAALASLTEDGHHTIEKQLESPLCTVAVVSHNSPHGGVFKPYLIYKANSPLGEGLVRNLPSVQKELMGYTPAPDALALSGDGQTLTYSYHYAEPIVAAASGEVIRQAGTYTYTVELAKGLPTLDYQPLPDVVNSSGMTTTEVEVEVRQYDSYDAAVADLRRGPGYSNEKIYETPDCDIYVFDRGGFMNAPHGTMVAVYKKGSALGEGAALTLPFARAQNLMVCTRANTMTLSDDKKSFTYTYTFEEELLYENVPVRGKGTFTYVFDIPSGKVTLTAPKPSTVSYASALAKITEDKGFTVERTLESPYCTIVLGFNTLTGGMKDYAMYYVYKAADTNTSNASEGTIRAETFSSTNNYVDDPSTGHVRFCTDRAPDTLALSKDGSTLFYSYDLGSGPMTEITGGGLVTSARDLVNGYYSSGHPLEETVEILSREATVEKRVDGASAVALLVYNEPYGVRDYVLYIIDRESGVVSTALLPSTTLVDHVLPSGEVYYPTDRAPDSISFSADGSILTYVYKFAQALKKDGTVYHEAGTYTYKVNVTTGELSVAHT